MLNAVLLNDTTPDNHHGCLRVIEVIRRKSERSGIRLIATAKVREDWTRSAPFLEAMRQADLVLINGEGTLHHGTPHGERLLSVVQHPARGGKPVHLLNAMYQENPDAWGANLALMSSVTARDSRSAAALSRLLGRQIDWMPDLTLCDGSLATDAPREGIILGDSVLKPVSRALAEMSLEAEGRRLVPILKSLKAQKGRTAPGRLLRRLHVAVHARAYHRRYPSLQIPQTPEAYAAALSAARLHVTGRFHGVCFSLLTETPFLAIGSNSWKMEALVSDLGLDRTRIMSLDATRAALVSDRGFDFTENERSAIRSQLAAASSNADILFNAIAASAQGRV
ncbi:polysaccharide pyruvyl transferase family protein [Halovulum dunhuangense]|uniref:Polysaccharide pyruvyl transferase family protein n=1 Tax=Halovulum dunhuangense TaxID=1505036 RepID=A0A849KPG8_9RHOB|nr:polysaccharide pyruvyl transferase family protein [Halovulum dunhuangense]